MSQQLQPADDAGLPSPNLVLASGSPRRRSLLALIAAGFEVRPPGVDESPLPGEEAPEYVERLARLKAETVLRPGEIVVAADTVVVVDGDILPKPLTPSRARAMLTRLSGRTHQVLTGLAVARWGRSGPVVESLVETTVVRFAALTDRDIDWYVAGGEPLDKAGGYSILERGGALVEWVEGNPFNVAGLPLAALLGMLRRSGFEPVGTGRADPPG